MTGADVLLTISQLQVTATNDEQFSLVKN